MFDSQPLLFHNSNLCHKVIIVTDSEVSLQENNRIWLSKIKFQSACYFLLGKYISYPKSSNEFSMLSRVPTRYVWQSQNPGCNVKLHKGHTSSKKDSFIFFTELETKSRITWISTASTVLFKKMLCMRMSLF